MVKEQLVNKFLESPYLLEMGAGKLSKRFKCEREDIYEAKDQVRKLLHQDEVSNLQNIISEQEGQLAIYLGSETTDDGQIKRFETTKPLTPSEIEELAGVDKINTHVARVWDKLLPSGKWTYSIDIRYNVTNFYSAEELKEKLATLLPNITPFTLPTTPASDSKILNIIISDDHCGMINTTNLFGSEPWDFITYQERLLELVKIALSHGQIFEEVHIFSLGDQLNGFNKLTTRGGHEVSSTSNKEQFDTYVESRIKFFDALFQSGLSDSYFVHEMNNSNHSGLGFSYMANKLLETYCNLKYPQVLYHNANELIDGYEYGNHIILFTHGKDEKFQKKPLPLNLNDKTDLFIYDWLSVRNYNPAHKQVTLYKGDLHSYNIQGGKFGRYVNVPSIAGASDYSDNNFGRSRAGALIEIIYKDSNRIQTELIEF